MDKLKINLIPPEIKEKKKKEEKRSVINRISIGLLGLLIIITASILAVIVLQNATLSQLNRDIESEKSSITASKDKEAVVYFLKNRIETIGTFTDERYKQGEFYELVTKLVPPGIDVGGLQIDKSDRIELNAETSETGVLTAFFKNLTDPAMNEGMINSVTVESLSLSNNGSIRFGLVLNMKEKAQ